MLKIRPRFGDAKGSVDPPFATDSVSTRQDLAERRRSDAAPLDNHTTGRAQKTPSRVFMAFAWSGKSPPHARQDRLASSVSQLWRLAETKKPGPSLL
ncbi:protein of unknown function [Methylocella tundrae]|uniref:Uncharacterized protein n=1 Tax=Methylocella tundrae TaxID=227605 RepID=A0A4U8Z096_METTU|nr:protein of unknown function [Methylocella tundrae]